MRRQQGEGHIDVCVQGADGNVGPIVIIGAWFTMVEEMTWLCWTAPWISNCTDMCCNKVYYPGHCKGHLPEQRCNAPPHTVRATRDFLENQDVEVMDWPSKRTDMKPIEHIWDQMVVHVRGMDNPASTVYPKKYAHGFVVLCFVVVMKSFIMASHEVFIHIHQSCFAGTGAIVRLPQCQWSKPDGYGKISQFITTTKHSKAGTVCIFLGIYCRTAKLRVAVQQAWVALTPVGLRTLVQSTRTILTRTILTLQCHWSLLPTCKIWQRNQCPPFLLQTLFIDTFYSGTPWHNSTLPASDRK